MTWDLLYGRPSYDTLRFYDRARLVRHNASTTKDHHSPLLADAYSTYMTFECSHSPCGGTTEPSDVEPRFSEVPKSFLDHGRKELESPRLNRCLV